MKIILKMNHLGFSRSIDIGLAFLFTIFFIFCALLLFSTYDVPLKNIGNALECVGTLKHFWFGIPRESK